MSDESMFDELGLLTFPGLAAPGSINLQGATPGDILISIYSMTVGQLGLDFTDSFMREVQFLGQNPLPTGGPFPYIVQTDNHNLSMYTFVALVRKNRFKRAND